MTWIKFHDSLCWGAKRAIPRAYRFVLLELALLAYDRRGYIELPAGVDEIEAVGAMLDGNRKEARAALKHFMIGAEPTIWFEGEKGARRLVIRNWQRWNTSTDKSTERTRKHRSKRDAGGGMDDECGNGSRNVYETVPGTDRERSGNVTPLILSSDPLVDRSIEIPADRISALPCLSADLKTTYPETTRASAPNADPWDLRGDGGDPDSGGPVVPGSPAAPPASGPQLRLNGPDLTPGVQSPSDDDEPEQLAIQGGGIQIVWGAYLLAREKFFGGKSGGRPPVLTPERRKLIRSRLRHYSADELALACRGLWATQFNTDRNFIGIEYAMKKVELYMGNATNPLKEAASSGTSARPLSRHDYVQPPPSGGSGWIPAKEVDLSKYDQEDL